MIDELLRAESRLWELRRATRDLEHRRLGLEREQERLDSEIEKLLARLRSAAEDRR